MLGRMRRRLLRHHVPIAVGSTMLVLILRSALESPDRPFPWSVSVATAYTGFVLLAVVVAIGPVRVLRALPNLVSSDLRRDLGIWSAIVSLAHVFIGLQIHAGHPLLYFLRGTPAAIQLAVRRDLFGLANYVGLAATAVVVLLFALSNDTSLRWLGGNRWKALQRSSYVLGALVVVHGVAFQILEKRRMAVVLTFGVISAGVVSIQVLGRRRVIKRREG